MDHKKACRVGTLPNWLAVCFNKNGPLLCPAVGFSSSDHLMVLQTLLLLWLKDGPFIFMAVAN